MDNSWLMIAVRVGQPGSERTLHEHGPEIAALIDPAANVTIIHPDLVAKEYEGLREIPYSGTVNVATATGSISFLRTVPMLIGLDVGGSFVHAQINAIASEIPVAILLGSDVLSVLGLDLRIDYQNKRVILETYDWTRFEDEVASTYRALGASVRQNMNLSGFQIDMLVEEETQSGRHLRFAVECKYYKERIGNRVVNDFGRVVSTLKASGQVDRGVIVAYRGFTQDASLVAQSVGVELLTLDDLKQQIRGPAPERPLVRRSPAATAQAEHQAIRRFFVVMPFAPELDDVYHLGIRDTVKNLGGACERADEIQYTGGVLEKIYDSIRSADAVIAEVSMPNPNVFYEIGFAHALGKPVVLLTRDVTNSPFDLRGYNHIVYSSIIALRTQLEAMLRQMTS
jgi:Restriction endonuclease/Nucleoside 2-deoxyribosyltransferase